MLQLTAVEFAITEDIAQAPRNNGLIMLKHCSDLVVA